MRRVVPAGFRWLSSNGGKPTIPPESDSINKPRQRKKKKKRPDTTQAPPPKDTTGQTGVTHFKARTIAHFEEARSTDEDYQNVQKAKKVGLGAIILGAGALLLFSGAVIFKASVSDDGEFWATRHSMSLLEQEPQVVASLGDPIRSNMGRMARPTDLGTFEHEGDSYRRISFPVTGSYRIQGDCLVEVKTPADGGPRVINYLEVTIPTQGKRIKVVT